MNINSIHPHIYLFRRVGDNSPVYVGRHKGSATSYDKNYITSGHDLNLALKTNGEDWFWRHYTKEIVCICNEEDLDLLEIKYIKEFKTHKAEHENVYNYTQGGGGCNTWAAMTEKSRSARKEKMSKATKGINKPHRTKRHRENISKAALGVSKPKPFTDNYFGNTNSTYYKVTTPFGDFFGYEKAGRVLGMHTDTVKYRCKSPTKRFEGWSSIRINKSV